MGIDGIEVEPAYGVLRSGDYIEAINGHPLSRKEDLVQAVNQTGGGRVTLQIRRGQEKMSVSMNPVAAEDGTYKLGAWVRDDTQGIGTMTYLDLNGHFGALGHGISDTDTGGVVEITEGNLYETQIMGIEKGSAGKPGVMSGSPIIQDGKLIGAVTHVFVQDSTRGYGIFIENMLQH